MRRVLLTIGTLVLAQIGCGQTGPTKFGDGAVRGEGGSAGSGPVGGQGGSGAQAGQTGSGGQAGQAGPGGQAGVGLLGSPGGIGGASGGIGGGAGSQGVGGHGGAPLCMPADAIPASSASDGELCPASLPYDLSILSCVPGYRCQTVFSCCGKNVATALYACNCSGHLVKLTDYDPLCLTTPGSCGAGGASGGGGAGGSR